MRLRPRLFTLFLALAVLAPPPASAAEKPVQLEDNAYLPPAIGIAPGDSVRWTYPATTEHHNVHFEDEKFTFPDVPDDGPWTSSRTFEDPGTYLYYCQEHGGPGRQGMSGVVYVNAAASVPGVAPAASFTLSRPVVRVEEVVVFDAAATGDMDVGDTIVRHEWDTDANGSYEVDTGTGKILSHSYLTPGKRAVGLRVTDSQGHTSTTTQTVSVTYAPSAAMTVTPNPAEVGRTVTFDGSGSRDADGTIAKYQWDLDGDGTFETDTGTNPTTTTTYPTAGTRNVKLLVTDDLGVSAETSQSLNIAATPPAPAGQAPSDNPGAGTPEAADCSKLKGTRRAACMQKTCSSLKGTRRAACVQKSCRYLPRSKRAACVQKSCRYLPRSKRAACGRKSCRYLSGRMEKSCTKKYRRRER